MHGFQEETTSFQVSITFFLENDKPLTSIGDIVYPITEGPDTNFENLIGLKKITKYYDTETREFKNQSKIIFTLEIISPKQDEIAKEERERGIESGIEDSDEEKEKDEKGSANENDKKNDGEN